MGMTTMALLVIGWRFALAIWLIINGNLADSKHYNESFPDAFARQQGNGPYYLAVERVARLSNTLFRKVASFLYFVHCIQLALDWKIGSFRSYRDPAS